MGAFFLWNVASVFFQEKCIMDCNIQQGCMALAFANINAPVYTDVCELSVNYYIAPSLS